MKFAEYENVAYQRYSEFAGIVRHILEKAISESVLNPPQSIQCRAKKPESLRDRLEEEGLLLSEKIENERRDLAGARIIFYTNTDVERFRSSSILRDNFEIEFDAIKIHHPLKENEQRQYRAIHYTVRLKENRASLPEYRRFKGMRCEIQLHTILNHAWSETSHDIAYKNKPREGFGTQAMDAVRRRLNRIMDKYLLPAGYEFQRVQHDFERLKQGKELFDQNILAALRSDIDNNERHELLESLKDHVLPNYDDVPGIFDEIVDVLVANAEASFNCPAHDIETEYGNIKGKKPEDILRTIVEILVRFRFASVEKTFQALCRLLHFDTELLVRKEILEAVDHLSRYDLQVWNQVGPLVQVRLANVAELIPLSEEKSLLPILIAVWGAFLQPEINGTEWKADSVSLSSASLPMTNETAAIRERATAALFSMFERADDDDRRKVWMALRNATRVSGRSQFSNEFILSTYKSNIAITNFLEGMADNLSFELRQSIEHQARYDYHRARELCQLPDDKLGCKGEASDLMEEIIHFRNRINRDENYVRYKTLVGYESVFPAMWDDNDRDFEAVEQYRSEQIDSYVETINFENSDEWLAFAERCASTKSDDLATFPKFGEFLQKLSERKPNIIEGWVTRANSFLLSFLPAILDGLSKAGEVGQKTGKQIIAESITNGANLSRIVRHWRFAKLVETEEAQRLLSEAFTRCDENAVAECVLLALEVKHSDGVPTETAFLRPALQFLTAKKIAWWINSAWFAHKQIPFFANLTELDAVAMLDNLVELPKLNYLSESIVGQIGAQYPGLIWDYFGKRLRRPRSEDDELRYEAVPYQFHRLLEVWSPDAKCGILQARSWFADEADRYLFRFRGARLLSALFPNFALELSEALCELVATGSEEDASFVVTIMENYHGEPRTHEVLKTIVAKYPNDDSKLTGVAISFDSTGVVMGEHGYANALREKKISIESWLNDERPEVRKFAEKHIRSLDIQIANEHRRGDDYIGYRQAVHSPDIEK